MGEASGMDWHVGGARPLGACGVISPIITEALEQLTSEALELEWEQTWE
jgi:hypothetical protein